MENAFKNLRRSVFLFNIKPLCIEEYWVLTLLRRIYGLPPIEQPIITAAKLSIYKQSATVDNGEYEPTKLELSERDEHGFDKS